MQIQSDYIQPKFSKLSFLSAKNIIKSSEDWNKFYATNIPSSLELHPVIFNYIKQDDNILDIGMGFGKTIFDLLKNGFRNLSGIDTNKSGIDFANSAVKSFNLDGRLDFKNANAQNLPFNNKSQNAVITQAFWTTIVQANDRQAVMNEINRVLKNNGILYIADFGQTPRIPKYKNRYEMGSLKGYDYGTFEVINEKNGTLEYLAHHYTKDEFSKLLQNTGFKIENYLINPVQTRSGNTIDGHIVVARKVCDINL